MDPKIYVANDAAATVGNLITNSGLVRIGVVAHMMNAVFFILTAMTLYILLKHVNKTVARTMLVLVALSAGITTLNAVFQYVGLRIATDSTYATAFGVAGSNALAQIFLEIQHYGTLSAQVFFGLWLVPLGYLAYRSRLFPRLLGYVLIAAAASYMIDLWVAFLAPYLASQIHAFMGILPAIAEIWMVLYLLIIGVRTVKLEKSMPAPTTE